MIFNLTLPSTPETAEDNVKGVIWTIMFHRLFGPLTPVTQKAFDVNYPKTEQLPELDELIDLTVREMTRKTEPRLGSTIFIKFYEKGLHDDKASGWLADRKMDASGQYLSNWETWKLYLRLDDEQTRDPEYVKEKFQDNIMQVLEHIDTNKQHIPPITSLESSPFPYTISYKANQNSLDEEDSGPSSSIEYVTETGDIITSSGSNNANTYTGEEILKTGLKFFRKMLSD